jgi:hypothetical protein
MSWATHTPEERREYNRLAKAKSRARAGIGPAFKRLTISELPPSSTRELNRWLAAPVLAAALLLAACSCDGGLRNMSDQWCEKSTPGSAQAPLEPLPSQSWDQANLKRHDVGCPSAVFIAPGGNLEQCE